MNKRDSDEAVVIKRVFPGWPFVWGAVLSAAVSSATWAYRVQSSMEQNEQETRRHAEILKEYSSSFQQQTVMLQEMNRNITNTTVATERLMVMVQLLEQRIGRAETRIDRERR